jgi:lysophospholipase L1-like esterase
LVQDGKRKVYWMRFGFGNWISVQQVVVLALLVGVLDSHAAGEGKAEKRPVQIVLVGDSTMCIYDEKLPDRGWGMFLEEAFKPGSVEVHNLASRTMF